jgi:hypothetical protein
MNDELVDLVLVDECPDQCSTAHHPDVLALLSPEMCCKRRGLFTDELHPRCPDQASRISGKDVVSGLRPESGSVVKAELICLSPKHDRIDGSAKWSHAVVTSRPWTIQPINNSAISFQPWLIQYLRFLCSYGWGWISKVKGLFNISVISY